MNNIEKFHKDVVTSILNAFEKKNIPYDNNRNDYEEVMFDYISILDKLISQKKRRVHISSTIMTRISGSDTESLRLRKLIYDMRSKFENGDDVNGHLSKCILKNPGEADKMLEDWNIYHLHLCEGNPDFFDLLRNQSSDLLMAMILNNDAYFIDITDHSSNIIWYTTDYLKIVKDNWENDLLVKADAETVTNANQSKEEIKELRRLNINSDMILIDNSYYCVKNACGYSTAGSSMRSRMRLIILNQDIDKLNFDYDHLELYEFDVNYLFKLFDSKGNCIQFHR